MNLSLSMMLSSFNVGYCSVAVGSASRCLRGSARSQRLRWKQRSGRSTARFLVVGAVGRGPRTESHGARGRPEAPGSWRTESEGEDGGASWHGSPPRASGFVAQRRGSESPASRGVSGACVSTGSRRWRPAASGGASGSGEASRNPIRWGT